ncbi:ABC transporter permease [Paenibacillus validus]|uniref:ABC transporter permease subunit n=1 Tax=Paenibacillus validus TaxID=44253 RepID=A0A7X2Z7T5_9BACL|nr:MULTISPECIES: ABC transporter permease [Paenibacillus]MED4600954.1 ABC transporter permease [Paenibacillus validus]MED4606953.1 ABC transporter permease [Paenibacillus validus]MUG69888.1 ABC transporter permease subunit [Paenibacillus validus]
MGLKTEIASAAPVQPAAKGMLRNITSRVKWGIGSVLVFLLSWEFVAALRLVDPQYISQPSHVAGAGIKLLVTGDFYYSAYISLVELVTGFILAVLVGVALGLLMGHYRIIGGLFDPMLMALYATPRMAMIPLFVIWFGVGMGSKIFVVFIGALFPVLINTITGIRQVDRILIRAARSYGATEWQLFTKVFLPGALPAILTGIRLGWGRGILGVVIGEMYVAMAGLGYMISTAGNAMQTDRLFFLILIVAGLGFLGTSAFQRLEQKLTPYREEQQGA